MGLGAASLNYRDLLILKGLYNPRLPLPQVPVSDGAGVVLEIGEGVTEFSPGDRVITHPVVGWEDGRFRREYSRATLGGPGPGRGQEAVVGPEADVVDVFGEVHNPGRYPIRADTIVLQALSLAGGSTEFAALNRIRILRMVDGEQVELKVGLDQKVQPDDIIRVPQKYF